MQITIHRGTQEVGGTCIELVTNHSRILLDVGLPLFDSQRQPLDNRQIRSQSTEALLQAGMLPAIAGLYDGNSPPDAILLSHAHLDHCGLLDRTSPDIPIYATTGTSKMMLAGSLFANQEALPQERFRPLRSTQPIHIGAFQITPFAVDHSIFGAVALLIEANGKSLLYSGDLRLHGRKPGMAKSLVKFFQGRKLDILVMEGTHFGLPDGPRVNEYELETEIKAIVETAPGLVLASFSPQHVDRLVAFYRVAVMTGRTFVPDAYTAFVMHLIKHETPVPAPGESNRMPVFFPATLCQNEQKIKNLQNRCSPLFTHRIEIETILANPAKHLMIFRPSMLEGDFGGKLPEGVVCLHSRWEGYMQDPDAAPLIREIQLANGRLEQVHTSGHILSQDIEAFVESLSPQSVIPVHTFEPEKFSQRLPNVRMLKDGEEILID